MEKKELLQFIEDRPFDEDSTWFFHATDNDIEKIGTILKEGIKSTSLTGDENPCTLNGKYYISLYNSESINLSQRYEKQVKFIIEKISPYYADREKNTFRYFFINTRIPLRTSNWDGEYQKYLRIDPSKIVGIDYHLASILSRLNDDEIEKEIIFLQNLSTCIREAGRRLPIYDLGTHQEINQDKVLSITL